MKDILFKIFGFLSPKKNKVDSKAHKKDFDIDEFNYWFNNEYTGYGGKGAPGIFLRTSKLSPSCVEEYLKLIGEKTDYNTLMHYYDLVIYEWRNTDL